MDFSTSGLSFSGASGILTWQGSPGYSMTLTTLSTTTVTVTKAQSAASCTASTFPYPLTIGSSVSTTPSMSKDAGAAYTINLLDLFTGDSTCSDISRSYVATISPGSTTYTLNQAGHSFTIANADLYAGTYTITLTATFPFDIILS